MQKTGMQSKTQLLLNQREKSSQDLSEGRVVQDMQR
jgi:hypothetical protein